VPPIHGGGVFMYQTVRELARLCELHLIVLLHYPEEGPPHRCLSEMCASVELLVKPGGRPASAASILPNAVREFASEDLQWLIHRQIHTREIDVLQLEYTPLGQYAESFDRLACVLFEHDVYFQSVARGWTYMSGLSRKLKAAGEYLRALYYETRMLPRLDRVQACSRENLEYLLSYVPRLAGRIQPGLRAGIDTSQYPCVAAAREPYTMLFVGSFRHLPNQAALAWFARHVLPEVCARRPEARLVIAGSDPLPPHAFPSLDHIELLGFVEDIRDAFGRYSVFVCPVLSGSGIRVKLLEAFASGMPVVSTRLGAEGLASGDGEICALADEPSEFAAKILALFEDPDAAAALAARARAEVERNWDMADVTRRLVESYREVVWEKRGNSRLPS
jgi:Glycosyltransferase